MTKKPYGYELILDLHGCDTTKFKRKFLRVFFKNLCSAIKMERCKLVFWDDKYTLPWNRQTSAHTKGTSAVQFILTSNITIHCLDELEVVYINIFSCKYFKPEVAKQISKSFFDADECTANFIERN